MGVHWGHHLGTQIKNIRFILQLALHMDGLLKRMLSIEFFFPEIHGVIKGYTQVFRR